MTGIKRLYRFSKSRSAKGKKTRILFLVPGLSVGGAERHTVDLRARLDARGFDTAMIVHGRQRSDVLLAHPGAKDAIFLNLKGMSQLDGWFKVYRHLKRLAPDIVIGVNQMPLIVAAVTRLLGGHRGRVGCIFHTTILRQSEQSRFFLFRWALLISDALIYVSANQKEYWKSRRLSCSRQDVILNGVDFSRFVPSTDRAARQRSRLGFVEGDFVISIVAAFRPEKNHEALIHAISALRMRSIPAKALFVGDGVTRASVEELARKLNVMDAVVFVGEQSDVRLYIEASDVGLICSRAVETFSLSALEFLAMGVPMIMSRIGGASEIVQHGINGLLFEPDDLAGMVSCLESVSDLERRARLGAAARSSIESLSIEGMVDRYAGLFEDLATGAGTVSQS